MTEQTGEHLNYLTRRARPVTGPTLGQHLPAELDAACWAVMTTMLPEAIADEIADAARERREADLKRPDMWGWLQGTQYPLVRRAFELARPQLEALVAAHNARTVREYEAYRVACEQRVAVPPLASKL